MKKYIYFRLSAILHYCSDQKTSECLRLLSVLFTSEVGSRPYMPWITYLDNPQWPGFMANIMDFERINNGEMMKIRLQGFLYENYDDDLIDENEDPRPAFLISRNQYIKMFWIWHSMCKKEPQKFVISWDGKTIRLESTSYEKGDLK